MPKEVTKTAKEEEKTKEMTAEKKTEKTQENTKEITAEKKSEKTKEMTAEKKSEKTKEMTAEKKTEKTKEMTAKSSEDEAKHRNFSRPNIKEILDCDDEIKSQAVDEEKHLKKMKNAKVEHLPLELDARPQFTLFGENIPLIDRDVLDEIEAVSLKTVLKNGDVVESKLPNFWNRTYTVKSVLKSSRNAYIVADMKHEDRMYFMKLEKPKIPVHCSSIKNELKFHQESCKTKEKFREHFLHMIGHGIVPNEYRFIVTHLGSYNLCDLRRKMGNAPEIAEFSTQDAVRLCMQTLQSIHDIHLCRYLHRDIQPKNFVVGTASSDKNLVYMVNFGLAFKYCKKNKAKTSMLPKFPYLSLRFQARAFHSGSEYTRLCDLESWLYMCFWFFDSKCLPWDEFAEHGGPERRIFNFKELLFDGMFDKIIIARKRCSKAKFLLALRDKLYRDFLSTTKPEGLVIDYPTYAQAILSITEEVNMDWDAPFEWQEMLERKYWYKCAKPTLYQNVK
ncbi:protein kinase domain-containing protein [Ditylenchus destructor]|uniref:Protein kinase domain-containing protein n=1 Tax=Ditylenchus destructor TaxID=166010 RepID=A0AAD4MK46_9BILA|nr:protein kinase domain-containing protein [Ditylenchus destructor]